jgi:hypothetical protein
LWVSTTCFAPDTSYRSTLGGDNVRNGIAPVDWVLAFLPLAAPAAKVSHCQVAQPSRLNEANEELF